MLIETCVHILVEAIFGVCDFFGSAFTCVVKSTDLMAVSFASHVTRVFQKDASQLALLFSTSNT